MQNEDDNFYKYMIQKQYSSRVSEINKMVLRFYSNLINGINGLEETNDITDKTTIKELKEVIRTKVNELDV